jgi:hypothetical protein
MEASPMNLQSFKNKNGIIILLCVGAIVLIYTVDIYKLSYQVTRWEQLGEIPIVVGEIEYFVADTPTVIGYTEPGGGMVSCGETVIYVKSTSGEAYRCCDTGDRMSCLAGNFSKEIQPLDPACGSDLQSLLGIAPSSTSVEDYKVFGTCAGASSNLTIVRLDNTGQIFWKFIDTYTLTIVNSAMRCIMVPLLLIIAIWLIIATIRGTKNEPIPRF